MKQPIDIACTKCGAWPGEWCTSRYGARLTRFHAIRESDAKSPLEDAVRNHQARMAIQRRRARMD